MEPKRNITHHFTVLYTEIMAWLCFSIDSLSSQDVLHRHPLYLIVRMLCYDDGLGAGKNLLALKTTDAEQQQCSIWVYQCSSAVRPRQEVSSMIDLDSVAENSIQYLCICSEMGDKVNIFYLFI